MNPEEAYEKAINAKRRLTELEPIVLQDVRCTYYYALDVIKGRWDESC